MNSEKKISLLLRKLLCQFPFFMLIKNQVDPYKTLVIVMSMTEDGFYEIRASEGILKQVYVRSQFTLRPKKLLRMEDIPNYEISL